MLSVTANSCIFLSNFYLKESRGLKHKLIRHHLKRYEQAQSGVNLAEEGLVSAAEALKGRETRSEKQPSGKVGAYLLPSGNKRPPAFTKLLD
jgi:hypothetical protein